MSSSIIDRDLIELALRRRRRVARAGLDVLDARAGLDELRARLRLAARGPRPARCPRCARRSRARRAPAWRVALGDGPAERRVGVVDLGLRDGPARDQPVRAIGVELRLVDRDLQPR